MVEVSGFDMSKKEAVFETRNGKIRVTFDEWKQLVACYKAWIEKKLK